MFVPFLKCNIFLAVRRRTTKSCWIKRFSAFYVLFSTKLLSTAQVVALSVRLASESLGVILSAGWQQRGIPVTWSKKTTDYPIVIQSCESYVSSVGTSLEIDDAMRSLETSRIPGLHFWAWVTLSTAPLFLQRKSKPFLCLQRMHSILKTTLNKVSFALKCELSTRTVKVTASDIESCNLCSKTVGHIIQTKPLSSKPYESPITPICDLRNLFATLEPFESTLRGVLHEMSWECELAHPAAFEASGAYEEKRHALWHIFRFSWILIQDDEFHRWVLMYLHSLNSLSLIFNRAKLRCICRTISL